MPRAFIRALGLIKHAAAGANAELGDLPRDIASAIQAAALEVAAGRYDDQFPVDVFQTGSGTSSNMNANEVIAALAARSLSRAVHPNDQVNMVRAATMWCRAPFMSRRRCCCRSICCLRSSA
jgi:fumarate hydratase class II